MTPTEPIRVLFAGGGTGGHLFPGVSVAREVLRRHPSAEIVFAGAGRPLEAQIVSSQGFALESIRVGGLAGQSVRSLVRGLALVPVGVLDAARLVRRRAPRVVVGLGGYSAGPIVLAAWWRGIPTMLLEQNAVPGITNRLLARIVGRAAVSYEATLAYFGPAGFVSGNPVRAGFYEVPPPTPSPAEVHVLVIGGSQGAHAINVAMVGAATALGSSPRPIRVTHQTGDADLGSVREGYAAAGFEARVEPFLEAMEREMAAADLVVCRAGATTLAELAAAGRPALLVPFPHATHDHQRLNASALAERGAAEVLDPEGLFGSTLGDRLVALATDDARRLALGTSVRRLARPAAAGTIVDEMERLLGLTVSGARG